MSEQKRRIRLRNDTAANWTDANPVLGRGEMGVEIDTKRFKFGDGILDWATLEYAGISGGGELMEANLFRRALLSEGVLTSVDTFIALQSQSVQIDWNYSFFLRRGSNLIDLIRNHLNMDNSQFDSLWEIAESERSNV